ncbi:MAG: Glycosyl transferase, group 1, partial [Parcubacteria group bacterium GW2011_GWC2_45_7]
MKKSQVHNQRSKPLVVFVSTFPPRQCGIGTYTHDLTIAIDELHSQLESRIIAMNVEELVSDRYPRKVLAQISEPKLADYQDVARQLNALPQVVLISVQHEFGIFGGEYGIYLLHFLELLTKPAIITFHTVLPSPSKQFLEVVRRLTNLVKGIIVMTRRSADILKEDYGISGDKIHTVPHGIHFLPYTDGVAPKKSLQLSNRFVLSTFGFLSRGKGIEYVIEALPQVVQRLPNLIYLVIGATHPTVLRDEGEEYRRMLMRKVYELGLASHVRFYNRYLPLKELLQFLQATDIYIATSLNPDHAVSGTLCYALGAGRPVISTAFAQAKEYVTEEVGALVDFRSPQAYAQAILALTQNNELRLQKGKHAYFRTRSMIWPNVAITYMRVFVQYLPGLNLEDKTLPPIKLAHLMHLSDSFGILQFANLAEPNPEFGYTVDDNARALAVAVSLASASRRFTRLAASRLASASICFNRRSCASSAVKPATRWSSRCCSATRPSAT